MSPQPILIVLSSYNGTRFLDQQIESIRQQTLDNWSLLIRDDGSSDDTVEKVEALAAADPRVRILRDRRGNLGPAASFGALLEHAAGSGAGYVALADQDDIWAPNKLEREFDLIQRREREVGRSLPLLVHSDLAVVAEDLSLIHPSFLAFQNLRHVEPWPLGTLLVQNFVSGCTVLINQALLRVAVPFPSAVIMHDWWLALCAAALGEVLFVPDQTVRYRQHGRNALGSRGWVEILFTSLRQPVAWWRHSGAVLNRTVEQAARLRDRLEGDSIRPAVPSRSLEAVREFSSAFEDGSALNRFRAMHRHGIRPRTLLPYPVRFYLRVLLWSRRAASD